MRCPVHFWHDYYVFTFTYYKYTFRYPKKKNRHQPVFPITLYIAKLTRSICGENELLKHGHKRCTTKTKLRHRYVKKKNQHLFYSSNSQ